MASLLIFLMAGVLLAVGIYYLSADYTKLWASWERRQRRRGIVSLQRTPEWERATRNGGWSLIAAAIFIFCFALFMMHVESVESRPQHVVSSDRYYLDGKEISEHEARGRGFVEPQPGR